MKLRKVLAGVMAFAMVASSLLVSPVATKAADTLDVAAWWNGTVSTATPINEGEMVVFNTVISDDNRGGLGAVIMLEGTDGANYVNWVISGGVVDAWGTGMTGTTMQEVAEFEEGTDSLFPAGEYDIILSRGEGTWDVKAYDAETGKLLIHEISTAAEGLSDTTFNVYVYPMFGKFVIEASNSVPVDTVEITAEKTGLITGETLSLSATTAPVYATEAATVVWSSSDEEVATVDQTGKVTTLKAGEVTITAKVSDAVVDSVKLIIADEVKPLTAIDVTADKTEIELNATAKLTVAYTPADTTDVTAVTWSTSDDKVLTVKDGVVTGVGYGKATITAKVGEFTDTIEITVLERPATAIDAKADKTDLKVGETATITTTVTPADTTDEVTYTSSNKNVVTVDATGKVSAAGAGSATVTVAAGAVKAEVKFTVTETSVIELEDLTCAGWWTSHSEGVKIEAGKTYTWNYTAKSTDSTNNWYCPVYVVYGGTEAKVNGEGYKEYFVNRADNYGWCGADWDFVNTLGTLPDGWSYEVVKTYEEAEWPTFREALAKGTDCTITAYLSGKTLVVKMTTVDAVNVANIPVDTSSNVYLSLTGEQATLTDITVTVKTIPTKGDLNMVLPLVLVLFGGAVVIVASKKRFA